MVAFSKTHTPSSRSHETRWREEESIYSVTSKPTFKDSMAGAVWRYLPFVRALRSRSGGKRVERVAIREDSWESVRWAAEERRDVGTRNRRRREKKK